MARHMGPSRVMPIGGAVRGAAWSDGPARWFAAMVLGVASVGGLVWSIATPTAGPGVVVATRAVETVSGSSAAGSGDHHRTPEPRSAGPSAGGAATLIDLNTATASELELLPRIGPALAARIIEYRDTQGPFRSVDAIDEVRGIGPATLAQIRPYAMVSEPERESEPASEPASESMSAPEPD